MPDRETFRIYNPGQKKNRHVFDSTAVEGVVTFASRIQGGLIPPWSNWMDYSAGTQIPKEEKDEADKALKDVTDIFFNHMNQSNFSTEITPSLQDLSVGTGAILVEERPLGEDGVLKFTSIPLAELYIENDDNAWRKSEVAVGTIKDSWPQAELTDQMEKLAEKSPDDKVELWNGMIKNKDHGGFDQVVLSVKEKKVIFAQSFKRKRLIFFRWSITPGERYGRGPIISSLPDIRTVNKADEFMLKNAAIQMTGIYTGVSDGVFNPHTAQLSPGAIIPVLSNDSRSPTLSPITPSGNLQFGELLMERRRDNIRKALFSDPLGDLSDPVRSATENMIRNQEMLRNSGAQMARLTTELLNTVVAAVTEILQSRGLMPDFIVDGEEVAMRPTSPLSQAEAMEQFNNTTTWLSTLMGLLPPEVVSASVKVEDIPKATQEMLSVNPDLVRSEDERAQIGKKVAEQIQEQGLQQGVQQSV